MKRPKLTREEAQMLAQIRLQRANKEKSRALPAYSYQNPADFIQFEREIMRNKKRGEQ